MNEILQQRIEEASIEYTMRTRPMCIAGGAFADMAREINKNPAFIAGANYALHNQWISVDEALPPIREKGTENRSWSDWVLIMTHKGGAFMDCYAFHRKEWLNNGNDVTHWMPIPSLEGGEE